MFRTFSPAKGNRKPAQPAPGAKGSTRPTRQVGGGGSNSAGTKEPTIHNVPVVTVKPSGQVVSSGFPSREAARAAERETKARNREILRTHFRIPHSASQAPPKPLPSPQSKPAAFQGKRTAGEPTRQELLTAAKQGTLKLDRAGAVTTPRVREVSAKLGHSRSGPLHSQIITTPEQSKVAKVVLRTGQRMGADRKEKLAALATGLQESGMRNLPSGGVSAGWRQEELQYYPEPNNVRKGAENFFNEAKAESNRGRGETIPHLAQAVQASGAGESFYADNVGEAKKLLHQFNRGTPSPQVKAQARELGLVKSAGPAPHKLVSRVVAAEQAMKEVKGLPYVWGGGHGSPTSSPTGGGLDCSGAVGYVLNKIHAMKGSATSGEMGRYLKPGPGALTVFYNAEHTFLRLINKEGKPVYWGTSVGDSGAGGLGPHPTPSKEYLAQYNVGHVPGMGKKQALQLGAPMAAITGGGSFGGMSFSPSGTTAQITGPSATVTQPGFSNKPIRLTPQQKVARAERKLRALSAPAQPSSTTDAVTIKDLEAKYGKAVV